ncbi:MAG: hypothetical protein ABR903_07805 [Thermodesulfovibrionales bacterium]
MRGYLLPWKDGITECGDVKQQPRMVLCRVETAGSGHLGSVERGRKDDSYPVKPQRIVADIRTAMGEEDIVVVDMGAVKMWMARFYPTYRAITMPITSPKHALSCPSCTWHLQSSCQD